MFFFCGRQKILIFEKINVLYIEVFYYGFKLCFQMSKVMLRRLTGVIKNGFCFGKYI